MSPVPKKSRLEKAEVSSMALEINSNSGFLRFEVNKVSTLDEVGRESEEVVVGGVPWRAKVCKKKEEGKDCLSINLFGGANKFELWIIDINAELTLLNDNSSKNRTEIVTGTYKHNHYLCGSSILAWDELMDVEKGFIKDDKIAIEIRSSISNTKGICMPPASNKARSLKNGVSSKVSDNDPNSGVIRFDVDKLWTLDEKGRYSPEVEVGGVPWKGQVSKNNLSDGEDYLMVYLICADYQSTEWSIAVKSEIALFNSDDNKTITERSNHMFCHEETNCGTAIINWKDLMDEEKGFITDGLITIEIRFSILKMQGIWIQPHFNSSSVGDNCSNIVLMMEGKPTLMDKQGDLCPSAKTRSDNDEVSGFISFEISVSDIRHDAIQSPVIDVQGTHWNLSVRRARESPFLGVHLYHRESESNIWSFDVSAIVRIINNISYRYSEMRFTRKLNHEAANWGSSELILWEDLINEEKGIAKDGKITIEARFTLSNFVGIRRIVPIDFTDRHDPRHDLTLLIEGKNVYVGKQILAFHSPVFNAMFYGNLIEKNKRRIELKEIDHKVFIEMLNLIYPSYQKINDDNAESLLKMGDYFQINAVIDQVERFLIDSSKMNVLTKFNLSDQYRLVKLQDHCFDTFKTAKDITDINSEEEYKELSTFARSALMDKAMKLRSTE